MNHDDQILRLQAFCYIQSADVSSLLGLLKSVATGHKMTEAEVDAAFLSERKKLLYTLLASLEKTQPELAAKIQSEIDRSCQIFPFDYE